MSDSIDNVDDNAIFDRLFKKFESLIDHNDKTISKLTENLQIKHKKILKQNNKIFELFKNLSKAKVCPINLSIKTNKVVCPDDGCELEKNILQCWKDWINE